MTVKNGLLRQVEGLVDQIESLSCLPEEHREAAIHDLGRDARSLYEKILELPNEEDRNVLFNQIIRALQRLGMIVKTVDAFSDFVEVLIDAFD